MNPVEQRAALLHMLGEARDIGILGPMPINVQIEHATGFVLTASAALHQHANQGSATPSSAVNLPERVLDLGSGGGLPGLVLALEAPDSNVCLLDSSVRRSEFLRRAIDVCGLGDRVSVLHVRAEDAGRDPRERAAYGLVVARSFGAPSVVAECAAPFLHVGGLLVVSEPPGDVMTAERWPEGGLGMLGMSRSWPVRMKFGYRVVTQVSSCPDKFPRRVGVPAKRHLF